jgi:organic radical activating enzyme
MELLQDLKLKRISNDVTTIDWHLGNHCQYSCTYCPQYLHANDTVHPELENMKELTLAAEANLEFLNSNKQIHFTFSGGEPTLNPRFGLFVKWLRSRGHIINVVTNGGRTLRWWEEWGENFNLVIFSFHTEFTDIDHFVKVVKHQTELAVGRTEVHLICWANKFDRIIEVRKQLVQIPNCRVIAKKISESWFGPGVSMTQYTQEQEQWISKNLVAGIPHKHVGFNFTSYTNSSSQKMIMVHPLVLRNYKLNQFKGWKCKQGIRNISIDVYGGVWAAHCRQLAMGNLNNVSEIQWPTQSSVCQTEFCHCATDIMINKSST